MQVRAHWCLSDGSLFIIELGWGFYCLLLKVWMDWLQLIFLNFYICMFHHSRWSVPENQFSLSLTSCAPRLVHSQPCPFLNNFYEPTFSPLLSQTPYKGLTFWDFILQFNIFQTVFFVLCYFALCFIYWCTALWSTLVFKCALWMNLVWVGIWISPSCLLPLLCLCGQTKREHEYAYITLSCVQSELFQYAIKPSNEILSRALLGRRQ